MSDLSEIDVLREQVQRLEEENARLQGIEQEKQDLEGEVMRLKAKPVTDQGGWMAYSTNPNYSGVSCGVRFRKGVGFIPRDPEGNAKRIITELQNDFGFKVREVKSIEELPEDTEEEVKKDMADVLSAPQILGTDR